MYPLALSRVLAVQPLLDAPGRDQGGGQRSAFENLRVGQGVLARVVGQTRDLALVSIEGQTVAMRLPRTVERGETLRLSFAGHLPQPSFALETSEADAVDMPQLSLTARMLSDMMQRVPERTPPTLTPAAPLLAQPAQDPAELAPALRTALVRSGLFYESHLANWVAGHDSLDGLLREPQNQLSANTSMPASLLSEAAQKTANPLHTLLTQQLQVLESPQLVWRGELWPGQVMEWQLQREDDAPRDAASPAVATLDPAWESHLKLSLPALGTVSVHIRLDARQNFSIRVMPESAESLPVLQADQAALSGRLQAAGCVVQALEVTQDAGA